MATETGIGPVTMAYLRKHIGLKSVIGFIAFIVEEVLWGYVTKALLMTWGAIVAFGRQPMGLGIALLILALIVAAIWSAVDPITRLKERITAKHADIEARLLRRMEIERVRELWSNECREAGEILGALTYRLATGVRLIGHLGSPLFAKQSEALQRAQKEFATSLDPETHSLTQVQGRIQEFIKCYWECGTSLAECLTAEPTLETVLNNREETFQTLDLWREKHPHLNAMIDTLNRRSEYAGHYPAIGHLPDEPDDFKNVYRLPRPPLKRVSHSGEQPSTESAS